MSTAFISAETLVVQATDLLAADLDNETILLSIEQGAYYGLSATAQSIWQQMEHPRRVADIVAAMITQYKIDKTICHTQTCAFLAQLADEGLIRVMTGGDR